MGTPSDCNRCRQIRLVLERLERRPRRNHADEGTRWTLGKLGDDTVPVVAARTQESARESRVREYLLEESDTRRGSGCPVIDAGQRPIPAGMPEHVREGRRIHKGRDALPGKRPEYTEPRDAARENDDWQLACRAPIHRHGFRTDLSLRIYRALRRRPPKGMNFRRWLDAPRRLRQCHRHDCGLRHYLACRAGDDRLNVGRKSCKCAAQIVVFV